MVVVLDLAGKPKISTSNLTMGYSLFVVYIKSRRKDQPIRTKKGSECAEMYCTFSGHVHQRASVRTGEWYLVSR